MDFCKVLVSPIGLPSQRIGSWTVRIQQLQSDTQYFDFVLSPTESPSESYIFCQKEQPTKLSKLWNRGQVAQKQVSSYLDQILKLGQKGKPLQLLVMDDKNLLEGIVSIKARLPQGSELILSHHGHRLTHPSWMMDQVDKVFFLSEKGYLDTFQLSHQFAPISFVVGNGVQSNLFFPISLKEKEARKKELGYSKEDQILIWMANSRPVKGLHLFKKIVPILLKKYPHLKILSIGHEPVDDVDATKWRQMGRVPHRELPKYLQLGSYYLFTSLWQEGFGLSLAEAVKCGNLALASNAGGIPELKGDSDRIILVESPNMIDSWIKGFEQLLETEKETPSELESLKTQLENWNSYHVWKSNYLKALQA